MDRIKYPKPLFTKKQKAVAATATVAVVAVVLRRKFNLKLEVAVYEAGQVAVQKWVDELDAIGHNVYIINKELSGPINKALGTVA